ncbi:MAG: hypothetical protein RL701_1675 [Pseudomonadota bacterium]|jgi:SAM-dependent methyltransferase
MSAPTNSADFDRAYRSPMTLWGDVRIPQELKELARRQAGAPRTSLELGCGVGRLTRYVAQQGLLATGVDFSPVAIAKARERVARDPVQPQFLVADATHLAALTGPFDLAFDVGCFHCFDAHGQRAYVSEVSRLLKPSAVHLIWALDSAPCDLQLSPSYVKELFAPSFKLQAARKSLRRLAPSHWYWLVRT